jgi:hypothetical protein
MLSFLSSLFAVTAKIFRFNSSCSERQIAPKIVKQWVITASPAIHTPYNLHNICGGNI